MFDRFVFRHPAEDSYTHRIDDVPVVSAAGDHNNSQIWLSVQCLSREPKPAVPVEVEIEQETIERAPAHNPASLLDCRGGKRTYTRFSVQATGHRVGKCYVIIENQKVFD